MSSDHPSPGRGVIAVPDDLSTVDRRQEREDAAIADVEARVQAGLLSGKDADDELLEIALARFDFLSPEAIEELRAFGRELNDEPEMVETRLRREPHAEGAGEEEDGSR